MSSAEESITRIDEMNVFIKNNEWGSAQQTPLKADASFRRYVRLQEGDQTALVMDAPPPMEDIRPFIQVDEHLRWLGFSAPEIYAQDEESGFMLLEDFGEATFTNLLKQGKKEEPLYRSAINTLIALHNSPEAGDIQIPAYSEELLQREADLLIDWYLPELRGRDCTDGERESYHAAWTEAYNQLPYARMTITLRDFHVDNLMLLPERKGHAKCGLLDFQDAVLGHPAYDVMSLLEDARRDIPAELQEKMLRHYLGKTYGSKEDNFMDWYAFLGAQRHAKVIGIFTRLYRRDKKDIYLQHIPRVCDLLKNHLKNPLLEPVAKWISANMPDFQDIPASLRK